MRISLSDDLYWKLVSLASDKKMRYYDLLESWIRDVWGHRDEKAKMPIVQDAKLPDLPHDSSKATKGKFSPEEIDQIKALSRKGWRPGKIAKELHRHKSSVAYAVDAMKKRGEL